MDIILAANEIWPVDRPDGMPTISSLEVMCGKDHMDVHLQFSAPFEGIVSSKGIFIRICITSITLTENQVPCLLQYKYLKKDFIFFKMTETLKLFSHVNHNFTFRSA